MLRRETWRQSVGQRVSAAANHAGMSGERAGCDRQVEAIANQSSRERRGLAVGAAVEAALRQDRLLFAFQPVVCAATGKVDYFECLLRMRDEQGGIVSGGEFITTVEELGWIGLIDRYVLEKTVQALAADSEVRLGLNIFRDDGRRSAVAAVVDFAVASPPRYRPPPRRRNHGNRTTG